MGLLSRKWVCGYQEGAIVHKVGLSQSRMGLLSKEWVCGYLEWLYCPESSPVAI